MTQRSLQNRINCRKNNSISRALCSLQRTLTIEYAELPKSLKDSLCLSFSWQGLQGLERWSDLFRTLWWQGWSVAEIKGPQANSTQGCPWKGSKGAVKAQATYHITSYDCLQNGWWPCVARWYLLFGMALNSKAPNLIKDHNLEGRAELPLWPGGTNVGSTVCPEACCPPILHLGFPSRKGDTSTASIQDLQWGL